MHIKLKKRNYFHPQTPPLKRSAPGCWILDLKKSLPLPTLKKKILRASLLHDIVVILHKIPHPMRKQFQVKKEKLWKMCVILFIHFSVVHYEANSEKSQDRLYSGPNFGFYRKQFSSEFGKFRFVHCLYIWNHWRLLPIHKLKKQALRTKTWVHILFYSRNLGFTYYRSFTKIPTELKLV